MVKRKHLHIFWWADQISSLYLYLSSTLFIFKIYNSKWWPLHSVSYLLTCITSTVSYCTSQLDVRTDCECETLLSKPSMKSLSLSAEINLTGTLFIYSSLPYSIYWASLAAAKFSVDIDTHANCIQTVKQGFIMKNSWNIIVYQLLTLTMQYR